MENKLRANCRNCRKKRYKDRMIDLGGTWLCLWCLHDLHTAYVQDLRQFKIT